MSVSPARATRTRVVVTLAMLCLLASSCAADRLGPTPLSQPAIAEIIDGDTIIIDFGTGNSETVRLLGIDTPETSDPTRPQQCFGAEATARLTELLAPGTLVAVERDVEARDRYGRLLAYVFRSHDQLLVNEQLLLEGYADLSIYEPNSTYRKRLTDAVTTARTAGAGLWTACGGPDVALDPSEYN